MSVKVELLNEKAETVEEFQANFGKINDFIKDFRNSKQLVELR